VAFFVGVVIYLLLYTFLEPFRVFINESQDDLGDWAQYNKGWMYLITFVVCLLGSASIVFPIPFPTVMFVFGRMLIQEFGGTAQLDTVLQTPDFWLQILGLALIGAFGCAFGEFSGYALGYGAKVVADKKQSHTFDKMGALAKRLTESKRSAPLLIFLFALTPLPDDILIIPLGIVKYPWYKCILPSAAGKIVTTLFYMIWPVLVTLGVFLSDPTIGDVTVINSGVYTEAIMFSISILLVTIIMSMDWQGIFLKWDQKQAQKKANKT
jgi:membrane protein YqaA with SNARE-associated domain